MPGDLQRRVLEMVAEGRSVKEAAEHICVHAECSAPGVLCSIVTVDREGALHPLAGPHVPEDYSTALDGVVIGPLVGSCGTAAFWQKDVAVEDIFADPLWEGYQKLARILGNACGVKACWSSPIKRSDGSVLGAFGFYYTEHRGPTERERRIVEACVPLCALALERDEARAENLRLAHFDPLTGLGNRASFMAALERAAEGPSRVGLLLVDIDHLGRVNDAAGFDAGDRLIREIAATVATVAPAYRITADEFALLFEGQDAEALLEKAARQVLRKMEAQRFQMRGASLPVSVSCGTVVCETAGAAEMLGRANLALQHAKQTGRGHFVRYGDYLESSVARRFHVLQSVTAALAEGRIEAHYQPIVRLDSAEIIGLEALCRMRGAGGEMVPAGQFAAALQDEAMGHLLTERMLELVAADMGYWQAYGMLPGYVSVNLSMSDFRRGGLRQRLTRAFSRRGVQLEHVVLEVTETVYMDVKDCDVLRLIKELREDGLRVALDDFGTGYASLIHLLTFPVDIIKVDKSFVDQISAGGAGEVIIRALLDMAKGLGVRIVAEGVESVGQKQHLERLGCRFAQGYLFGRAADREVTARRLAG